MPFAFLRMSNHLTGPGGNSTSSVKSFFKDVGHSIAKFGGRVLSAATGVYSNTIGEAVRYYEKKSLSNRKANIVYDMSCFKGLKFRTHVKRKIKDFFRHETVRHVAKFLLFAAGTALFIAGMFFPPVSAIAALTILGIAVTRFIFKAVHIIKQASNNYFVGNRINTIVKTIFRLLIAAAEIPAFFLSGPLASLITQPISGAILGIMKAYDDIKTEKRMDKTQKWDDANINELDDYDNNVEFGGNYGFSFRDSNIQDELYNTQDSTNSNVQSKGNSTNNMNINYA